MSTHFKKVVLSNIIIILLMQTAALLIDYEVGSGTDIFILGERL